MKNPERIFIFHGQLSAPPPVAEQLTPLTAAMAAMRCCDDPCACVLLSRSRRISTSQALDADTGADTQAFEDGYSQDDVFEYTKIDPWFVAQFWEMHQAECWLKTQSLADISAFDMLQAKKRGFSDSQIARFTGPHLAPAPPSLMCTLVSMNELSYHRITQLKARNSCCAVPIRCASSHVSTQLPYLLAPQLKSFSPTSLRCMATKVAVCL